ncbi:hypothetical protein Tco_0273232 [Tanacetum coccineum]
MQLEEIRNFKKEGDETLYQAWEWYNDLLYKCPTHDINNHQKIHAHLEQHERHANEVQLMHERNSDPLALVISLWLTTPKSGMMGAYLDKDRPLNEEVKGMEEVKYGEFSRPFPNNKYDGRFNKGGYDQPLSGEKRPSLTEIISKNMEEASKIQAEQDKWLKKFYKSTKANRETHEKIIQGLEGKEIEYFSANSGFFNNEEQETDNSGMAEAVAALEATLKKKREEPKKVKQNVNYYVDPYEPLIPFPKRLEHHAEETLVHQTIKSLKKIKINRPLLKEIRQTDNYAKQMKYLVENKPRTKEDNEIKMNPKCFALLQNHLPPKEQDPGSFILPCSIGKLDFKNALADS